METQVEFDSEGTVLRGMLHVPESAAQGSLVFCAPFAEEEKCSYRPMVDLARACCSAGFRVLRFSYRGCGDSGGEFEASTLDDWMVDTLTALDLVSREAADLAAGLMGLRLGASVAAQVAEVRPDLRWLLLWEPVVDGERFLSLSLKRKLLRKMITEAEGEGKAGGQQSGEDDGSMDFDGYLVTQAMQDSVRKVKLHSGPRKFAGDLLVVQIAAHERIVPPLQRMVEQYTAARRCQVIPVIQQPIWAMLDLVPSDKLVETTMSWLVE